MNPANPKVSPDGRHVVSGFGDLWLDDAPYFARGQHPGWIGTDAIGHLDLNGYLVQSGVRLFAVPFNTVAMGGGNWIGTNSERQTTYTSRGDVIPDSYCPAMSPDGSRWACLTGNNALVHDVLVNGVRVASGRIDDKLSIANDGAVVFSIFENGLQQTFGVRGGQLQSLKATFDRYEVDPVVVLLPTGEHWVVSHDDTRTLVRPWGSTLGYALPGAKTPHAEWHKDTNRLCVVGDLEDRLLDVRIDLAAQRVDLSRPDIEPPPPPEEEVKPPKITVRDYPRVIKRDGTYDRPLVFEDGNGQTFTVTLDGWSTRIEGRDKDGQGDKTGQRRTVRVESGTIQAADPSRPVERIGQSADEAMAQSEAAEGEGQS